MKKIIAAILIATVICSFNIKTSLKGIWEYSGGIYNGKTLSASKEYKLHRKYDTKIYESLFIEEGVKPVIYERGNYTLKNDTCFEMQTYSSQPSKVIGVAIKYRYHINNDTLTLNGVLPNGTIVEEYWKKVSL